MRKLITAVLLGICLVLSSCNKANSTKNKESNSTDSPKPVKTKLIDSKNDFKEIKFGSPVKSIAQDLELKKQSDGTIYITNPKYLTYRNVKFQTGYIRSTSAGLLGGVTLESNNLKDYTESYNQVLLKLIEVYGPPTHSMTTSYDNTPFSYWEGLNMEIWLSINGKSKLILQVKSSYLLEMDNNGKSATSKDI